MADEEDSRIRADDADETDTDESGPAPHSIGTSACFAVLFVSLVAILLLSDAGREPQETRKVTKRKTAQPASFVRIRSIRVIGAYP
jgi:hypothetical protein